MVIYVKIGEKQYPASITGRLNDKDWDNRETKSIDLEMSYQDVVNTFVNGVQWSIVQEFEEVVKSTDEEGNVTTSTVVKTEEYDNSEYSLAGDIIDHRDGTITVKMGKLTELEEAYEIIFGGNE